jgi:hypothetical protein
MKRELWETLSEVVHGLTPVTTDGVSIRIRAVELDLPMEIDAVGAGDEAIVRADLPRWRWPTEFDVEPGRLRVRLQEGEPR